MKKLVLACAILVVHIARGDVAPDAFSIALDQPDLFWTAIPDVGTPKAPSVLESPEAVGGSVAVLPHASALEATVVGPRLVLIDSDSSYLSPRLDGAAISITAVSDAPAPRLHWQTYCFALPDAEPRTLRLNAGDDLQLDRLRFIEPPATFAEALGLSAGSVTTGPDGTVTIAPLAYVGGYRPRLSATPEGPPCWVEVEVTGPAEVTVVSEAASSGYGRSVLVDGHSCSRYSASFGKVGQVVEVGPGTHAVRFQMEPFEHSDSEGLIDLIDFQVRPLSEGEGMRAALAFDGPLGIGGSWQASSEAAPGGGSAVEPLDAGHGTFQSHLLTGFTGPGVVTFWWHQARENMLGEGLAAGSSGTVLVHPGGGWRRESLWIPPGNHSVGWAAYGEADFIVEPRLGGIEFTPSPVVPLGEALGASHLPWETDAASPWAGASRDGETFAVSPAVPPPGSSTLGLTLQGSGHLTFRWRPGGGNYTGEFRLNGETLATLDVHEGEEFVEVPITGPLSELEWIVHRPTSASDGGWIELFDIGWTPVEADLTEAAVLTPGHALETTDGGWHGVPYLNDDGEPDVAVRCVGGSPILTMPVTGPASVRFKARSILPSGSEPPPLVGPRGGLSAYAAGSQMHIGATEAGAWRDGEIHVPPGNQVVGWQLTIWSEDLFPHPSEVPAEIDGLEGWVDDIEVILPSARFAEWATTLPEDVRNPDDDADGDGYSNLFEYAFGSAGDDADETPPIPFTARNEAGSLHLMLPWHEAFVRAALEFSDDLETWEKSDLSIQARPDPLHSYYYLAPSTTTHQALPLSAVDGSRFFRVRISLGG